MNMQPCEWCSIPADMHEYGRYFCSDTCAEAFEKTLDEAFLLFNEPSQQDAHCDKRKSDTYQRFLQNGQLNRKQQSQHVDDYRWNKAYL